MDRLKKDFTTITLVLIVIGIALNVAIGSLVGRTGIPLYLDSIGTVLVGLLAGPWAGALTGLISNLLATVIGTFPQLWAWAPVAAVIGLLAGYFGRFFRRAWIWLVGGVATGFVAALLSAPISAYLFGGVTGTGQDFLVAFFRATGSELLTATLGQGLVSDPLDKFITFLLVWLIVRALPVRFLSRFPRSSNVLADDADLQVE